MTITENDVPLPKKLTQITEKDIMLKNEKNYGSLPKK